MTADAGSSMDGHHRACRPAESVEVSTVVGLGSSLREEVLDALVFPDWACEAQPGNSSLSADRRSQEGIVGPGLGW